MTMAKQKILEVGFGLIEAIIGDDLFDYKDNQTTVLATLAAVWGAVSVTKAMYELAGR